MEENEMTKKCSKCGRELPVSEFYKNNRTKDGYCYYCKSCHDESVKKSKCLKKDVTHKTMSEQPKQVHLNKVYSNPELAKFQPRELIAELRARGYSGELSIRQVITV